MNAIDVLSMVRRAGGRVVVLDGDLRIVAPPGTLTPEMVTVLLEHKEGLISILPDAEREAIVWTENLPPDQAAVVVETARREWGDLVGDGSTPGADPGDPDHDLNAWAQKQLGLPQILDPGEEPSPCPTCGKIAAWWDPTGKRHCMACESATLENAKQLATKAQRLREKGQLRFTIKGKTPKPAPPPWPPADMQLPNDLDQIEAGRPQTHTTPAADTREARASRLLSKPQGRAPRSRYCGEASYF